MNKFHLMAGFSTPWYAYLETQSAVTVTFAKRYMLIPLIASPDLLRSKKPSLYTEWMKPADGSPKTSVEGTGDCSSDAAVHQERSAYIWGIVLV